MPPKSNMVLIKWKTPGRWYNCEQEVHRTKIEPKEGLLEVGQQVRVKFSKSWSPAEICRPCGVKSTEVNTSDDEDDVPLKEIMKRTKPDTMTPEAKMYQEYTERRNRSLLPTAANSASVQKNATDVLSTQNEKATSSREQNAVMVLERPLTNPFPRLQQETEKLKEELDLTKKENSKLKQEQIAARVISTRKDLEIAELNKKVQNLNELLEREKEKQKRSAEMPETDMVPKMKEAVDSMNNSLHAYMGVVSLF